MISIILPNLNTPILFLEKRLETIFKQSNANWECIVIDGYSNNKSWEYIKDVTKNDHRFKLYQLPKKGIYNAWNEGIIRAKGELIYIATSDDTMSINLIEKMSEALDLNSDCGIAHCGLTIIDENDKPFENWWENFWSSQYFGSLLNQKHKRLAPHDGVLHMAVQTVYTSITQILIRKSLFDKIGLFKTDAGPIADFEWGMRASLITNVIYLPEKLATWRVHEGQATSNSYNDSAEHRENLIKLATNAISVYNKNGGKFENQFDLKKLFYVFKRDQFYFEMLKENKINRKIAIISKWSKNDINILLNYFLVKIKLKKDNFDRVKYIRNYINFLGIDKNIKILK